MVFTSAVRGGWSRRAVLGAVGGAGIASVLSGCSVFDPEASAPPPDPLEPLLAAARALAVQYEGVLAAHSELVDRLAPLAEAHRAHEAALVEAIGRPDLATASPATDAWSPPVEDGTGTPEDALAGLREAERAGRDQALELCLAAPPERAPLIGSITAARATHLEVLA